MSRIMTGILLYLQQVDGLRAWGVWKMLVPQVEMICVWLSEDGVVNPVGQ
jgi:hypothetical protein